MQNEFCILQPDLVVSQNAIDRSAGLNIQRIYQVVSFFSQLNTTIS